uniref:Uncharacterized protein n=1 Tax=Cajanus cajan TaxID=3821 RepID=A0A151R790_CAJCA|nr:hypothetical protein KK1_040241 [Cajanus cajan]
MVWKLKVPPKATVLIWKIYHNGLLFYEVLENVKFPHGYALNISCCIRKRKISGFKTRDCHVMMQELLPLCLRGTIDQRVSSILIELCTFFRVFCSKVLKVKKNALGFTLVNFSHLIHFGDQESHEPFVFVGQVEQVIFVQDPHDHEWFIPRKIKPRDIFDMGKKKVQSLSYQ